MPKPREVQSFPGRRRDLQHHPAAVADNLDRDVDDPATQRSGVTDRIDHRHAHVLLERLVEKEGNQHHVIEGRIGREALERQLFKTEILQRPVNQFVAAPAVVAGDDRLRVEPVAVAGIDQRPHRWPGPCPGW